MLCLVVLDVVIDKMGFGTGAARRDILNALGPIVRSAEPAISMEAEEQIADLVLGTLLNERERRQQIAERYAALDGNVVVWREFAYRLLEEIQLPMTGGAVDHGSESNSN